MPTLCATDRAPDPAFSVILPTRDRAHLLPRSIRSALAQAFTDWEMIIVDDQKIIDQLADLKYRLTRKGLSESGMDPKAAEERALAQKNSFNNASIVAVCNIVDWERSIWLCIENISLACVAEGLGSGIVLYWAEEKDAAGKLLGLPEGYEMNAVLKVGVPGEEPYTREKNPMGGRRPEFSWLHKNRYQE